MWLSADATKAKQPCFSCGSPDHLAPYCPLKASVTAPGLCCPTCNHLGHTACDCPLLLREPTTHTTTTPSSVNLPMRMTISVVCTTKELSVLVAQSVHTCTYVQSVGEATHDVPAPSRHNDISTQTTHTPLRLQTFVRFFAFHPNQAFVSRLIHSLMNSFDIGYIGPHTRLTAPNLPSAYQYPTVVDKALQKEIAEHSRTLLCSPI